MGTSSGIRIAEVSLTTVSSTKTEVLANWNAFSPPTVKGRPSLPSDWRQKVGFPRPQAAQRPQLPSVVNTTWSPSVSDDTSSAVATTVPAPS